MEITIPSNVQNILDQIKFAGGHAYVVGGALRDLLRGLAPQDYDIATSLPPQQLLSVFPGATLIGGECGTVLYSGCEITPFRCESDYADGRHPQKVEFCEDIYSDLSRRDFTINALAFDGEKLIDPFFGANDINNKILRTVGDAKTRFSEDYLRILRLFRFAATTNFTVDIDTYEAAVSLAFHIESLSKERVKSEMQKILLSDNPAAIAPLIMADGLKSYGFHSEIPCLHILNNLPAIDISRWWALCKLCDVDYAYLCNAFAFSNGFYKELQEFERIFCAPLPNNKTQLKQIICASKNYDTENIIYTLKCFDERFVQVYKNFCEICQFREPYLIRDLAISGGDLLQMGAKSAMINDFLQELLQIVIKQPQQNNRETLMKLAKMTKAYF